MTFEVWNNQFRNVDTGDTCRTLAIANHAQTSQAWRQKQEIAIPEYLAHAHESEGKDDVESLCKLFRAYIASAIFESFNAASVKILDVGCGVSREIPKYIGHLAKKCTYVGLDPIDVNRERDYLFVLGTIEALPKHLNSRFDIIVFSTSLDHFEDIPRVATAVRRVAGQKSLGVFFVGLHDPLLFAEMAGREHYRNIFQHLTLPKVSIRAAKNFFQNVVLYRLLSKRELQLRHGIPLDAKHFYYFTGVNLQKNLEDFGELVDLTTVPGTNAAFAMCRIHGREASE